MIAQFEPQFDESERVALIKYLEDGGWLMEHRKSREFEEMLAAYFGVRHAVLVANATLGLAATIQALQLPAGSEVICPAFTMVASATAISLAGATPVFVDIDRGNLCLDLDLLESAVTPKTRAIMAVSLNGRAPDMQRLLEICRSRGLPLIEDAAQSMGSRHGGRFLGTFGAMGVFSFSVPKIITTGAGGVIITDDTDLHGRLLRIKNFGRAEGGGDDYESLGYNYKFTDLQAVVGIEQMKKIDMRIALKKNLYARYANRLSSCRGVRTIPTDLTETTPWFNDILVEDREGLGSFLKQKGVGVRNFYPATSSLSFFTTRATCPVAEDISRSGLWLPSGLTLAPADVDQVCAAIEEFAGR